MTDKVQGMVKKHIVLTRGTMESHSLEKHCEIFSLLRDREGGQNKLELMVMHGLRELSSEEKGYAFINCSELY